MKREVKIRPIHECRWDERLNTKVVFVCLLWMDDVRSTDKTYVWMSVWWKTKYYSWGICTSHTHWIGRGTGTHKDKDEVDRREVWDCDVWACVLEVLKLRWKIWSRSSLVLMDLLVGTELILFCGPRYFGIFRRVLCSDPDVRYLSWGKPYLCILLINKARTE